MISTRSASTTTPTTTDNNAPSQNTNTETSSDEDASDSTYHPDDEDFDESSDGTVADDMSIASDEVRDIRTEVQQTQDGESRTTPSISPTQPDGSTDVPPTSNPATRL
ncbi:hypothetical protein G6F37_012054 [Rhizopus arrhizus]|nr:hypothetical protein G6F38_012084 [Rhizopus arrhizus]KAG1145960.1 hypothetical protein G6F37_012054 [Rhizopus arrhizus]